MSIFVGNKERREYSWILQIITNEHMMTMMKFNCGNVNIIITLNVKVSLQTPWSKRNINRFFIMDAIYSRPWSRHNNTRGRRDARLKNMCIKVGFSDDSKGTFVCFFLLWCFMNFGKDTWYLFPFFPGILHLWFWWLWCFFLLHFSFFLLAGPNFELYIVYVPMMSYRFRMSIHIKQPESNPFTP